MLFDCLILYVNILSDYNPVTLQSLKTYPMQFLIYPNDPHQCRNAIDVMSTKTDGRHKKHCQRQFWVCQVLSQLIEYPERRGGLLFPPLGPRPMHYIRVEPRSSTTSGYLTGRTQTRHYPFDTGRTYYPPGSFIPGYPQVIPVPVTTRSGTGKTYCPPGISTRVPGYPTIYVSRCNTPRVLHVARYGYHIMGKTDNQKK